ncbi:MAG: SPOR domain-containing protein, partial [Jannaschia sp.]
MSACQSGGTGPNAGAATRGASVGTSVQLIERDIEAPEVFQANDRALWDGRPSLGGVWVASPGVKDPERVIIRNEANGKFVIGALFKRERDNPGPSLQLSSDAATALGIIAGQPTTIDVVALRREEVEEPSAAPAASAPEALADAPDPVAEEQIIQAAEAPAPQEPQPDVIATAGAALDDLDGNGDV